MREVMPERYIRISQKDSSSQALCIRYGAMGPHIIQIIIQQIASSLLWSYHPRKRHQSDASIGSFVAAIRQPQILV